MFEIIKAEEKHIVQLVPLLASTGYWDFGLQDNKLNITNREFLREAIVKPYLDFTYAVVEKNKSDTLLGVVVCSGTNESLIFSKKYDDALHPEIGRLFHNIFSFEIPESFHISFIAVAKDSRNRGLGRKLLEFAETKGKEKGYNTLSLYTVNCQTSAIKLYHQFGMIIKKVITVSEMLPFPFFLYFEKNKDTINQQNYFDTDEYKNLELKNLI